VTRSSREKRGYPADDHRPGDPSRLAAVVEPAGTAGLFLLPPTCSSLESENGNSNGVVRRGTTEIMRHSAMAAGSTDHVWSMSEWWLRQAVQHC
jgi:hypothetical protein